MIEIIFGYKIQMTSIGYIHGLHCLRRKTEVCETAMLRRRVPVESDIVDGQNLTHSSVYFEYNSQCLAVDTIDSLWLVVYSLLTKKNRTFF